MPNTTITNTVNYGFKQSGTDYTKSASATITRVVNPTTLISIAKVGSPSSVASGGVVNFTVTVTLGDVGVLTNQVLTDILPTGLTYVAGSLKVDNVATSGTPASISVNFLENTTHTITYQCTVS